MYNEEKTIRTLFANARGQLIGKFGTIIGANVLASVIAAVSAYVPAIISANTEFSFYISTAITFIISLFIGVLYFGISKMYLKIARGNEAITVGDMFNIKGYNIDKILVIRAFPVVIEIIFAIFTYQLRKSLWGSVTVIGWLYLLMIIQGVIVFLLDFFLLFANFVLIDNPDMQTIDILKKSCELLNGRRVKYLLMALIFIPLRVAGYLACGAGLLWVEPFIGTVKANFYLDSIGEEPLSPEREEKKASLTQ